MQKGIAQRMPLRIIMGKIATKINGKCFALQQNLNISITASQTRHTERFRKYFHGIPLFMINR